MNASEEWYKEYLKKQQARGQILPLTVKLPPVNTITEAREEKRRQPNKTEIEYASRLRLEFGIEPIFEGITLKFRNGHSYRPDWVIPCHDSYMLVEVKARGSNGYRQPSYQRAKLAYDQAKVEYSQFYFRWVEKSKGEWHVSK